MGARPCFAAHRVFKVELKRNLAHIWCSLQVIPEVHKKILGGFFLKSDLNLLLVEISHSLSFFAISNCADENSLQKKDFESI